MDSGMEAEDVAARSRVEPGCHRQRQLLTVTGDDHCHRRVSGGIQGATQIFELVDGATVDGANYVTGLQPGVARGGAGVDRAYRDRRLDLGCPDGGGDADKDKDRQREIIYGYSDDDHETLPERVRVEAAGGGVHAAVHPGQLYEATAGGGPDGVERLAARPGEELMDE